MTHFLPITRVAEHSYTLRVTEELCVGPLGHVFLFGGAGLGAAVSALEQYNAKATFFVLGSYVKNNSALIQRMVDEGHGIRGWF